MPTVTERINVSVDTGDLDQRVGAQVAQLQQIIALIAGLIDNPPRDLGDFQSLIGNLPLPEFSPGSDFTAAFNSARGALPADLGDLTGALDGDLAAFADLIEQLQGILQDSVKSAAALETLVSLNFRCDGHGNAPSDEEPAPGSNPAAERMTRTAEQTEQVNALLDKLPANPTAGGLLEFLFGIIDNKQRNRLFQVTLPVVDDIIEPLRTLSRWSALDPNAIGAELETTLNRLTLHLRDAARNPLDVLTADLGTLQPQLDLPAITAFADAYATALGDLVTALEGGNPPDTTAPVNALNLALDNAQALFDAWDAGVADDLQALCARLHDQGEAMLDRISHLLTLLEPVSLPDQLVGAIPTPQPPDAAAIAAVQEAVEPVLSQLENLVALLDFSALQGQVGGIASQAQALAATVEQGLTGVALEVQALFDELKDQLATIDLAGLQAQVEGEIQQFGDRLQRELGNAFTPAATALTDATQQLSDALDGFDPADIVAALQQVLQAITGVLESGEVADAIDAVREAIATITETLEQLSFSPVTDEVVGLIEQMTDALSQLQQTDLNDAAKAALSVALEVLPDDLKPVTDPLLEEFDDLIEGGPVPLLERVAEKPAQLLAEITRFQPGALIGDSLGAPYRQALDKAEAYRPSALMGTLDAELQQGKQILLDNARPSRALEPLGAPFESLKAELEHYSPDTLLAPLEAKIEATIQGVIDASPVDEVFEPINRVFDLINEALAVPTNLVQTLERIDTLMTQLADSDTQIDGWRDTLLDKVLGVGNLGAIGTALTDLATALSETGHDALLARFDNEVQPLRDALTAFDPGSRLTALVVAHNRARGLAGALPDSAEKSAVLAALDRLDPGRAEPLRLTRTLLECLDESRAALVEIGDEWQALVEDPQGLLAEMAGVGADANGLRTLLANAVEPLLAPVRYLFRLLQSVQPALQGMLASLTTLVDNLTSGVAALVTGPNSLQSISDAIQQVVDTLRNIDLGFLRQSLQSLFVELLDQLEALNPAQLGQALDAAMENLLEPIGLDQIIPPATLATLDSSYEATLDKLRQLDPEKLITEVVQPEYEATVVPLVEAFDLTPAFNALVEFLRNLAEELAGELERVNGAYQGLRAARPALGSINVNISL